MQARLKNVDRRAHKRPEVSRNRTGLTAAHRGLLLLAGWFYLRNDKPLHSAPLLKLLDRFDPGNSAVLKLLCYCCLKLKDYEKALGYSNQYLDRSFTEKDKMVGCFLKSRALWGMGHHEEANSLMQSVVALRKDLDDADIQ